MICSNGTCSRDIGPRTVLCPWCGTYNGAPVESTASNNDRGSGGSAVGNSRPRRDGVSNVVPSAQQRTPQEPDAVGAIGGHFDPTVLDIEAAFTFVRSSPFVQSNSMYRGIASSVTAHYDSGDSSLNAIATGFPHELSDGVVADPPSIVVFAGLLTWSRLMSAFLSDRVLKGADRGTRDVLRSRLRLVGDAVNAGRTTDIQALRRISSGIIRDPVAASVARAIAGGLESSVMAHELGHSCLGHVSGSGRTLEISRNQEREADSFASSVLSTASGGEASAVGQILFEVMMSWREYGAGIRDATSHPRSRERVASVLETRSDDIAAIESSFGIGKDDWLALLPFEPRR